MRTFWVLLASAAVLTATGQPAVGAGHPTHRNGVGVQSSMHDVRRPAPGIARGVQISGLRTEINFDPGTAPCGFSETQPLRDEYASVGVHFQGPAGDEGGAILNQCGRFDVRARSGREFLAFNTDVYAKDPETITFDDLATRVACFVANGEVARSTFWLIAKRDGHVVAKTVVDARSDFYTGIAVQAKRGIDMVVFRASTPDQTFVVDDLSFRPMG